MEQNEMLDIIKERIGIKPIIDQSGLSPVIIINDFKLKVDIEFIQWLIYKADLENRRTALLRYIEHVIEAYNNYALPNHYRI